MEESEQVNLMFDMLRKTVADAYALKYQKEKERRIESQNNPSTKAMKSYSMKKYWKNKKKKEQEEEDAMNYIPESCYCMHTSSPPCGWCTRDIE
jgi:hypothetical protein